MNKRLRKKIEECRGFVEYWTQGNFTIAVVMNKHGAVRSAGVAKRNPNCDEFNAERGREIALAQAVKSLLPEEKAAKK